MSQPILLALSRLNSYFECPRKYYWSYEHERTGISGTKTSIPLVVGGSVHRGLQAILQGVNTDEAIRLGLAEFTDRAKSGIGLEPTEDILFVYKEQQSLIEGLIRTYAKVGYPQLIDEYEIVEVEQEYDLKLSPNVIIRTRADGLLRHRENRRLYVLSFKTAKRYDSRYAASGNHDVQGISEAAAIEGLRGEEVLGVQMQYLIKGDRSYGTQNSILVHPWFNSNTNEFATRYRFVGPDGKPHTLAREFKRINIWDHMSISDWVARLSEQPDGLSESFVQPMPFYRRREEIDSWKDQSRYIGERLYIAREKLRAHGVDKSIRTTLDEEYPQNRRACDWPSPCTYQMICFGPCGADPVGTGLYRQRREWKLDTEEE